MRLLPCIRINTDRWWLPLTADATEAIAAAMLRVRDARREGDGIASSASLLSDPVGRRLHDQLHRDPSLWIYTAVAMSSSSTEITPRQMTHWLIRNALGRFASGEAYLSAPMITPNVRTRWDQLSDYFRTLPRRQWMDEAELWLELLGPTVPANWRRSWPIVVEDRLDPPAHIDANDSSSSVLQRLARRQLRQRSLEDSFGKRLAKDKLASLKQFAYGLSHEINNPLANISTRAQQLQRTETDAAKHATLQRIIDQVYRAHEMIADLMFYANPPSANVQACEIAQVVGDVVDQFDEEVSRQSIRVETELPDYPLRLNVDGTMIGEAVRVLIRNAIDAIGCQGTIVVSMIVEPNGLIASESPRPQPRRVILHVADSGPGVSADARRHAFDPYYSGREAGRGLGVGLCRAYRIVQMHQGTIALAGGPAGCVATISLPVRD